MPEAAALRRRLLAWFLPRRRPHPWRADRDPYRVWISEVMLQQTRLEVVAPRFTVFVARFPDACALAAASEEAVLAAWSGLGYYSRARNLHRAARALVARHGGVFPRDPEAALALPGVGPYTAAAVLSLAYDAPLPVVDGNVIRVLARLHARAGDPRRGETARRLHADAEALLDRRRPGLSNEAVMELGQTVCLPRAPRCGDCPLETGCAARARGRAEAFPERRVARAPRRERQEAFLVRSGARLLLVRRAGEGALRGLFVLPSPDPAIRPGPLLAEVRHSIMDRRITLLVREGTLQRDPPAGARWVALDGLDAVPCSSQVPKALRAAGLYPTSGTGRPSGPTAT